jgi:hypothetical protein
MEPVSDSMGLLSGKEFAIPVWEVILFVIVISACLLLGRNRLGLVASYCFVFYWGFISNMTNFASMLSSSSWGMPLYVFAGFLMFIVAIAGFFIESRD